MRPTVTADPMAEPLNGHKGHDIMLSVFFEGTHNTIDPVTTQVGWFFEAVDGADITEPDTVADLGSCSSFKMGFDGCGVVCGLLGTVFALGLKTQVRSVARRVKELMSGGRSLRVVCFGLSRGGCAGLMLARQLARIDPHKLELSLCLFDPVPGNLLCTVRYLDVCGMSTAAECADVSGSRPLRSVLALYPYEALSDLLLHAPLLARYPEAEQGCDVEEDATLGCHQGALYLPAGGCGEGGVPSAAELPCLLSFVRVKSFLEERGVPLRREGRPLLDDFEVLQRACLRGMADTLKAAPQPHIRFAHRHRPRGCGSSRGSGGSGDAPGRIVRHATGKFLNRHHRLLASASSSCDLRELAEGSGGSGGGGGGAGGGGGDSASHRGDDAAAADDAAMYSSWQSPPSPVSLGLRLRALVGTPTGSGALGASADAAPRMMLQVRHGDSDVDDGGGVGVGGSACWLLGCCCCCQPRLVVGLVLEYAMARVGLTGQGPTERQRLFSASSPSRHATPRNSN